MSFANIRVPYPINEKPKDYAPGSEERQLLQKELERQLSTFVEIPLIIGGKAVYTGITRPVICPHNHQHKLGVYHCGNEETVKQAVSCCQKVAREWQQTPWEERAAIFLKAAELLAGKYRYLLNAATMLGQSKSVIQAEIDAACELIDYFRFNVFFMNKIYNEQIYQKTETSWTRMEYRPLEGFIFAITPFNFTAISGNLPTAPAMMGNTVIWKPASTSVLSSYYIMQILREAGLPDGVINFIPGSGNDLGPIILDRPELAGIHFTGSTDTFKEMWKRIGFNVANNIYKTYPRIVGETGGKGFVLAYKDADVEALSVALFRGAFEYQGQKCSAASRAYIPKSLWNDVRKLLAQMAEEAIVGDVSDFRTFMGAVIDKTSFSKIVGYIEEAKKSDEMKIEIGGFYDSTKGYFIHPTVIVTSNPKSKTMVEEIFGPVLTVYVYDDERFDEVMDLVDETSPYALTGSIFARDRAIIRKACQRLFQAAGNLYINDKPTGAVVGQQPFGGARLSGTNDKAGSFLNLLRWTSPRTIKENFAPPIDFTYPHMRT